MIAYAWFNCVREAMLKPVFANPWVQAIAVVAGLVSFCVVCYVLSPVLIPLFFAFLVAYMLDPVVDRLESGGISRRWAIAIIAVVAIVVLLILPVFLVHNLITGAQDLIQAGAEGIRGGALQSLAAPLAQKFRPFLLDLLVYVGWVGPGESPADLSALIAQHIGEYVQLNAVQFIRNYAPQFVGAGQWAGTTAAQVLSSVGRGTIGLLEFLGSLALFAVVTVYLLRDFDGIVVSAREFIPPRQRERVTDLVVRIDEQIHGFLRGQILVCACLAVMYSAGLTISGVPFAVPIGLIGGAASFVPYLGFALTSIPSLVLVLLQHGIDWHVIGVVATFGIAQAVEGTFLTPKIVGDKVGLGPVWVILAIMVFSSLLGFVGLLLAVPMAAALKVLVLEGLAYYRSSSVFTSSDSGRGPSNIASGSREGGGSEGTGIPDAGAPAGSGRLPRKRIKKSS
jgi:predicted PurR-regulated permease PerM